MLSRRLRVYTPIPPFSPEVLAQIAIFIFEESPFYDSKLICLAGTPPTIQWEATSFAITARDAATALTLTWPPSVVTAVTLRRRKQSPPQ